MRRARLSLIAGLVACGGGGHAPYEARGRDEPLRPGDGEVAIAPPPTGAPAEVVEGALWSCTIDDYDPMPCRWSKLGTGWTLAKLLGSQRFVGRVTFLPKGGFHFDGEFFCPWAACTPPWREDFWGTDDHFSAMIGTMRVEVVWNPDAAAEFGGAGYGGLDPYEREPD